MKKVCSWSKELKESKSYKEMLGVDWEEYENGFSEEWDVAIGMKVACMLGWSWDLEEED